MSKRRQAKAGEGGQAKGVGSLFSALKTKSQPNSVIREKTPNPFYLKIERRQNIAGTDPKKRIKSHSRFDIHIRLVARAGNIQ